MVVYPPEKGAALSTAPVAKRNKPMSEATPVPRIKRLTNLLLEKADENAAIGKKHIITQLFLS
jgi:hypothetical protein